MKTLRCFGHALSLTLFCLVLLACGKSEEAAAPAAAPEASAPAAAASASGEAITSVEAGSAHAPEIKPNLPLQDGAGQRVGESDAAAMERVPASAAEVSRGIGESAAQHQTVLPPASIEGGGIEDLNQRRMAIVAAAWRDLKPANIAFNVPPAMRVRDKTTIELLLSFELAAGDLKGLITAPGLVQTESIPSGPNMRMRAHLMGDDFDITPIEAETHDALLSQINRWSWAISPKTSGDLTLHLTIEVLPVEGDFAVKSFDKTIHVNVSLWEWVKTFVVSNWQWLWTTILAPLLLWWWKQRKSSSPIT